VIIVSYCSDKHENFQIDQIEMRFSHLVPYCRDPSKYNTVYNFVSRNLLQTKNIFSDQLFERPNDKMIRRKRNFSSQRADLKDTPAASRLRKVLIVKTRTIWIRNTVRPLYVGFGGAFLDCNVIEILIHKNQNFSIKSEKTV
jgi:hypothetical protein